MKGDMLNADSSENKCSELKGAKGLKIICRLATCEIHEMYKKREPPVCGLCHFIHIIKDTKRLQDKVKPMWDDNEMDCSS